MRESEGAMSVSFAIAVGCVYALLKSIQDILVKNYQDHIEWTGSLYVVLVGASIWCLFTTGWRSALALVVSYIVARNAIALVLLVVLLVYRKTIAKHPHG